MGSWLNSIGSESMLVSRYGYTDDSVKRGWSDLGVNAGSCAGIESGTSAVRLASASKFVSAGGAVVSPILGCHCKLSSSHDGGLYTPTSSRSFATLKNPYYIKRFLTGQCVYCDSASRADANHGDALYWSWRHWCIMGWRSSGGRRMPRPETFILA